MLSRGYVKMVAFFPTCELGGFGPLLIEKGPEGEDY